MLLGVVVGYLIMTGWKRLDSGAGPVAPVETAKPEPSVSGIESEAGDSSASGALPPLARERSGSSVSVVGGMSPEDLTRLQRELAGESGETPAATPAVGDAPLTPAAGPPLAPGETPASVLFPPEVREEARRYLCLCGCGHDLATCPCNDQPIGAVTMLTYLQKLMMQEGTDPDGVADGMIARYGERVILEQGTPVDGP